MDISNIGWTCPTWNPVIGCSKVNSLCDKSSFEWFNEVVNACKHFDIPVFAKQLGKHLARQTNCKTENGTALSELPTNLQIRQFPINISQYVCNQP